MTNDFLEAFPSDKSFYLADPSKVEIKANGGERWEVKREFYIKLDVALEGHLDGTLKKGVVLPPINSNNECIWGAIDVDGNIYKDDDFKKALLGQVKKLKLPLLPCFSKSRGIHFFIRFTKWTDANLVSKILETYIKKLELPEDTERFPKQSKQTGKMVGNGIMLPFMEGVGNDWIKSFEDGFQTGTCQEFLQTLMANKVDPEEVKLDLFEKKKTEVSDTDDNGYTKIEILQKLKDGTIEQHPIIGGHYYSWVQIVICKAVKQGYGDNEILQMLKQVHKDTIGDVKTSYDYPESYKKQINYTRGANQLNIPNPGDTNILNGKSIDEVSKFEELRKTYCYVMANDMFNKIGSADFYQKFQINNFHKHEVFIQKGTIADKLLANKKFAKAETFITSAKYPPGIITIDRPGIIPLVQKGKVLNIYIPNYIKPIPGDVKFIVDFYKWLIGEDKWKIIEQWLAFNIQNPGVKCKWAIVLVSKIEGAGKGLLARICSRIFGFENVNENADYKHLTNTHNTLLIGTQILVLNELSLGDFKSKSVGTNSLKNFVADDYYSCNFKNKPMVKLPNFTNFLLFSNDEQVVKVENGSRRYFFCKIKKTEEELEGKSEDGTFDKLWEFVDSDIGASALLNYFKNEVKIADPTLFKKRAPKTDDLKELIEQSKHPVQKKLEYDLTRPDLMNRKIFTWDFPGILTFDWLNDKLNTQPSNSYTDRYDWGSFGDDALYKFLSTNCIPWNNGENTRQISIDGVRQRFYLLDDSKCLFTNKSYRDLKPQDIELIYKNYSSMKKEINSENGKWIEANEGIETEKQSIEDGIRFAIELSQLPRAIGYTKFKGKTFEQIYLETMQGVISPDKAIAKNIKKLREHEAIIKRGLRTPEQIIDTYRDKEKTTNDVEYEEDII